MKYYNVNMKIKNSFIMQYEVEAYNETHAITQAHRMLRADNSSSPVTVEKVTVEENKRGQKTD